MPIVYPALRNRAIAQSSFINSWQLNQFEYLEETEPCVTVLQNTNL